MTMAICSVAGICCGKLILKVDKKAMTRYRYNRIPHPTTDTSREEQKDEQYQLELPATETLSWNDQYNINGGVRVLNPCTQSCH